MRLQPIGATPNPVEAPLPTGLASLLQEARRAMMLPLRERKYYSRQSLDAAFPARLEDSGALRKFAPKRQFAFVQRERPKIALASTVPGSPVSVPYPPAKYAFFPISQSSISTFQRPSPPPVIAVLVMGMVGEFDSEGLMAQFPQARISWVQASPVTVRKSEAHSELRANLWIIFKCIPDANVIVFSTDATGLGWLCALDAVGANHPLPSVLNLSWGWPESNAVSDTGIWTDTAFSAIETTLAALTLQGISVCAASGNKGSQVYYPGSSEFVLSCAGTVFSDGDQNTECAWSGNGASGGGSSRRILVPEWQKSSALTGPGYPVDVSSAGGFRLVPDVAAYALYPQQNQTSGTSCAAPLWSAALAAANRQLEARNLPLAGNINALLYCNDSDLQLACSDVTAGNNRYSAQPFFRAAPGWDACTGWGTPNVQYLIRALLRSASKEHV